MARGLVVEVTGTKQLIANINGLAHKASDAALRALREEAEIEMTEAKQRTPVDTGALRASGRVMAVKEPGGDLVASLEFGNASVEYALYVHENTESFHPVGQAKFLESTLMESLPHLPTRIGKRIAQILKGSI